MLSPPHCFLCGERLGLLALWRCLRRPAGVAHLRVTLAGLLEERAGRWVCAGCKSRAHRTLRLRSR